MVRISDAELKVMQVIWNEKEVTSSKIIECVKENNWTSNTVRTLINRLISKKAVESVKKDGKAFIYKPLIEEREYKIEAIRYLINKLYNGSVSQFFESLIENDEAYSKEIKQLLNRL